MSFNLDQYLKISKEFSLGVLTTESFHPKSKKLSQEVKTDIAQAVKTLCDIDVDALNCLRSKAQEIYELQVICQKVISNNHKIFLSGCGATGRLALSIEKLFREKFNKDNVVGFMAGGDYALIKSVESFEDNKEYGARQLLDLGFNADDLVIGITEGGETTFVIGSTEYGAEYSKHNSYFLYCNPDEELIGVERSRAVIENGKITKLNLSAGPMAISGSTRMQATTVQMTAMGFALLYEHQNFEDFKVEFDEFINNLISSPKEFIVDFIRAEHSLYKREGLISYTTDPSVAICVLTDTTERSPTFTLPAFERMNHQDEICLSYLCLDKKNNSIQTAWEELLSRKPRCLAWDNIEFNIREKDLYEFDISESSLERRASLGREHMIFKIKNQGTALSLSLGEIQSRVEVPDNLFFKHMYLKVVLNIHSTLVMGLLERFEGNMMTFVKPSNYKLIDRSLRYIKELLRQAGVEVDDKEIVKEIFHYHESKETGPVVIYVRDRLMARK